MHVTIFPPSHPNQTLASSLPHRQQVLELPTVDWDQYRDGLQALAQSQSAYNTRKRTVPALTSSAKV